MPDEDEDVVVAELLEELVVAADAYKTRKPRATIVKMDLIVSVSVFVLNIIILKK